MNENDNDVSKIIKNFLQLSYYYIGTFKNLILNICILFIMILDVPLLDDVFLLLSYTHFLLDQN